MAVLGFSENAKLCIYSYSNNSYSKNFHFSNGKPLFYLKFIQPLVAHKAPITGMIGHCAA
jgi:hypothetical protein